MKGGVRQRGLTWSYYFDLGIVNGKRKKKEKGGFRTKGAAEKSLRNSMVEYENGGYILPKTSTFMQFSTEWLKNYVKVLRKISTYNRYRELINKYLQTLGGIPIQNITSYQIEQLFGGKIKTLCIKHSVFNGVSKSISRVLY